MTIEFRPETECRLKLDDEWYYPIIDRIEKSKYFDRTHTESQLEICFQVSVSPYLLDFLMPKALSNHMFAIELVFSQTKIVGNFLIKCINEYKVFFAVDGICHMCIADQTKTLENQLK